MLQHTMRALTGDNFPIFAYAQQADAGYPARKARQYAIASPLPNQSDHQGHDDAGQHRGRHRDALIRALGLHVDPFRQMVSEQEEHLPFNRIYISPTHSLLADLQRPRTDIVFGAHGMGKSATRLALEYAIRLRPGSLRYPEGADAQPALAVRYTLEAGASGSIDLQTRLDHLRAALDLDMVIQAFERQNRVSAPISAEWRAAFTRASAAVPLRLRRTWTTRGPYTDGIFWGRLRPKVQRLNVSERWQELFTILTAGEDEDKQARTWDTAIADARALGFGPILVLLDAIDEASNTPDQWFATVFPLLNSLAMFQSQGVWLKFFLPAQLQSLFEPYQIGLMGELTPSFSITTMGGMSEQDLARLLQDRFRAARRDATAELSFDLLLGDDLEVSESIDQWLVQHAHGSPRRLIELVSKLLDYHTTHGFQDNWRLALYPHEWREYQERVAMK